jgi:hypothetical protein
VASLMPEVGASSCTAWRLELPPYRRRLLLMGIAGTAGLACRFLSTGSVAPEMGVAAIVVSLAVLCGISALWSP